MQGKTSLSENAFEARLGGDGQKHRAPSSIGRRLLELGIWILELGISISSIENESLDRRVNSTTHFQSRPRDKAAPIRCCVFLSNSLQSQEITPFWTTPTMKHLAAILTLLLLATHASAWEIESTSDFISIKDAPKSQHRRYQPAIDSALIRKKAIAMVSIGKERDTLVVSLRFENVVSAGTSGSGTASVSDNVSFLFDSKADAEKFYSAITNALTSPNHTKTSSKSTNRK